MEAEEIIANFSPKAVRHTGSPYIGYSVLIKDDNSNFAAWIDVDVSEKWKDLRIDWNQYIFFLENEDECIQKEVQEDSKVFELADSCAVEYLLDLGLLVQDDKANWSYGKEI